MADINEMNEAVEPLMDWDDYEESSKGGEKKGFPKPASYTFRTTAEPKVTFYPADKAAGKPALIEVQIDPIVVGGEFDGFEIRYHRENNRKYKGGARAGKASGLADYFRAVGLKTKPETPEQVEAAAAALANRPFDADMDWNGYCKTCKTKRQSYSDFPPDGKGGRLHYDKCSCEDPKKPGEKKTLWARARLYYKPKDAKTA